MPNQGREREHARAARRPSANTARRPPRSGDGSSARPEEGDRAATTRAHGVVVRARQRSSERPGPGAHVGARSIDVRGPFAGRGPKGYRREDRRIREDICDLLLGDSEVDATEIVVSVAAGEVTFDGTVSDRATKHYVECMGAACLGVTGVQNNLRTPGMSKKRGATVDTPTTPSQSVRLEFDRTSGD